MHPETTHSTNNSIQYIDVPQADLHGTIPQLQFTPSIQCKERHRPISTKRGKCDKWNQDIYPRQMTFIELTLQNNDYSANIKPASASRNITVKGLSEKIWHVLFLLVHNKMILSFGLDRIFYLNLKD